MNNGMNTINTDAGVERAWVAALSDARTNNPMHMTPIKDELSTYGNDADVMMTIAICELKG